VFLCGATDFSPLLLSRDQHHGQSPWCIRVLQWGFQPPAILLRRSRNKVCFRAPTLLLTSSSETWRLLARMLCRCSWSCIILCWVYKDCVDVKPSPSLLCLSLLVKNGDGSLTVCLIVSSKKRITSSLGENSFCRIRLSFREALHHHVRTKLKWSPPGLACFLVYTLFAWDTLFWHFLKEDWHEGLFCRGASLLNRVPI
jgi:hypothetical protein